MNPTEAFFDSRLHTTHKVLGKTLRPFCLLDMLALEAVESPFVVGGSATIADVAVAVNLLSNPINENLSVDIGFANPGFFIRLRALVIPSIYDAKISLKRLFSKTHAGFRSGLEREVKNLEAYFADYVVAAEMWHQDGSDATPLGAHWIQTIVSYMLRETNLTQTEIWTHPVGQIRWTMAAVEEQTTSSRIKTEHDVDAELLAEEQSKDLERVKETEIRMIREKISNGLAGEDLEKAKRRLERLTA